MHATRIWAAFAVAIGLFAVPVARAQTYATGAILTTEAEALALPQAPRARGFLPVFVDLGSRFPPVQSQGQMGSCVAWAVGHAAMGYLMNETAGAALPRPALPAPGYIYSRAKDLLTDYDRDDCSTGSRITDALKVLQQGTALEREFPYNPRSCAPVASAIRDSVAARGTPLLSGSAVIRVRPEAPDDGLDAIKQELARGYPLIIGLDLNPAFERLGNRIWDGTRDLDADGGHAVTITGYDEVTRSFSFVNSWGTDWGARGFGRLSYETLVHQRAILHTIRMPGVTPRPADAAFPAELIGFDLPAFECARLDVQGNTIRGYLGSAADLASLRRAVGTRALVLDVALRPWPQCEVLATLDPQLVLPNAPQLSVSSASPLVGETLTVAATTAGYDGFLHLAYFQADGSVAHLVQPQPLALRQIARGSRLIFGDGIDGRPRFTVQAPFGPEMLLAIQSGSPLFDAPRPRTEDARSFLTALRAAMLAQPFADRRPRVVTAAILALETKEFP